MRRRNIKNAHERLLQNEQIIILDAEKYKGCWKNLFQNDNPIYLEIGMGKGDFIIEHAKRNPNINYIGLEKYESVILQAVMKAKDANLKNLFLVCFDATKINDLFCENEIEMIYLNFSDPWPKTRHEKRRLTSPNFLKSYELISKDIAKIEFKTDNQGLFEYSLKSFNNCGWTFDDLTFDLHQRDEDIIMTEYEKKFHEKGNNIYFVKIHKGR